MIKHGIVSCLILICMNTYRANGQKIDGSTVLNGEYTVKGGLCSASFLFKPDKVFYYEGGCEARSSIGKGHYELTNGKLTLLYDSSSLQYSIKTERPSTGGNITLALFDVDGKPLRFFKVFALPVKVYGDTVANIRVLQTDSTGLLVIGTSPAGLISFDRFSPDRLSKEYRFRWEPVSDLPGSRINVQFNYPVFCLRYPEINTAVGYKDFKRVMPDDVLIDGQNNIYVKKQD